MTRKARKFQEKDVVQAEQASLWEYDEGVAILSLQGLCRLNENYARFVRTQMTSVCATRNSSVCFGMWTDDITAAALF